MRLFLDTPDGPISLDAPEEEALSRAIWLRAELSAPPLCSGLGHCGLCRVRFMPAEQAPPPLDVEHNILGAAVEAGWRLACHHAAKTADGLTVAVPPGTVAGAEIFVPQSLSGTLRLAVDLGTTSIHWQALGEQGLPVAHGRERNPQCGAGTEVMSRLAAAVTPDGRAALSALVRGVVNRVIVGLEAAGAQVGEICLAANPAMTAIFLNLDISGLLAAPYALPLRGGETVTLPGLPPIWLPTQPAPFVGGDASAAMAWALHAGTPFPFLLADMGTNGECVLALDARTALITSVPLGPALEGIGLACGALAGPGSITAFSLNPEGLVPAVMGGGKPRGLCGTGVLSLLDALLRMHVLTPAGTLGSPCLPLGKRLRAAVRPSSEGWRLPLSPAHEDLFLSVNDVEAVLKVRAAFVLAVQTLLDAAGLRPADVRSMLLAGSLGEHAPLDVLEHLGFIPQSLAARTWAIGNAALHGAALLARQPEWRSHLMEWNAGCRLVDTASLPDFMARYADAMRLEPL